MKACHLAILGTTVILTLVACGTDTPEPLAEPPNQNQATPATELSPPPGCETSEGTVSISSTDVHYDQECVEVPAGTAFKISYANGKCNGCGKAFSRHNIAIYATDAAHDLLFRGRFIPARTSVVYDVPALDKGIYTFQCNLHPRMNGTLAAS